MSKKKDVKERPQYPTFFINPQASKEDYRGHFYLSPRFEEVDEGSGNWDAVPDSVALRYHNKVAVTKIALYEGRILDFVKWIFDNLPPKMRETARKMVA